MAEYTKLIEEVRTAAWEMKSQAVAGLYEGAFKDARACRARFDTALASVEATLERVSGLARKVIEAEDATVTFEAGCNCPEQTAGYVCGDPGPCGWNRHIPTYEIAPAVALESAIDELRTALQQPTSTDQEKVT